MPRPTSFQLSAFVPAEEIPFWRQREKDRTPLPRTHACSYIRGELSSLSPPFSPSRLFRLDLFFRAPSSQKRPSFVLDSIEDFSVIAPVVVLAPLPLWAN